MSVPGLLLERVAAARVAAAPSRIGRVTRVVGLHLEIEGIEAAVGELVMVDRGDGQVEAEVVALQDSRLVCMPFGELSGIRHGSPATAHGGYPEVQVGDELLGRILDGHGRPIDNGPELYGLTRVPLGGTPPHPLRRGRVDTPISLGVRTLDTLVPCGRGQRLGIFAGSGVGKSSLLSMIARGSEADVTVIALIGERGREVGEFIERDLGPEGLARSIVVVATSDEPALVRIRAAFTAIRIAEWFRDLGRDVVLMMDSVTRFAMAQREVALSAGEPPATRGYPPSVFALLPRLLERAGCGEVGSITGLFTVLVDGDDINEPIADTTRSILDGHVMLSRKLAISGHYPAIDVLGSLSRLEPTITTPEQHAAARSLRELMAAHESVRDLLDVGAYSPGSNPIVDRALRLNDFINAFLRQDISETVDRAESWATLQALVNA